MVTARAPSKSAAPSDIPENEGGRIEVPTDPLQGKLLLKEWLWFAIGCCTGLFLFPLTATTVAATVLWDGLDRGFMGQPQEGVLMTVAKSFTKKTESLGEPFVRNPKDAFLVHVIFLLGVMVPSLFLYSFWRTLTYGFSPAYCFLYHVFRLGPYFMNFAYCYALCHKEGHAHAGLFKGIWRKPLGNVFNWWAGLFYGVMPSTFAYGHSINHHKYNNGPYDVISTADKPRDNFRNFICYLPRFILYAVNVSTIVQFFKEGQYNVCFRMFMGNAWWAIWFFAFAYYSPQFAFWYIAFPIGENALLLSCINWTWHAFLNPEDPEDEFVGSITILGGPIDVLGEDLHVVHHQYPGAHWSTHEQRYKHHLDLDEYKKGPATVFQDTHAFEVFALIVLREYDELARKFVDMSETMSHEEKKATLQRRLRACWWGPRRNLDIELQGKELGNHHLGHTVQRQGMKEE